MYSLNNKDKDEDENNSKYSDRLQNILNNVSIDKSYNSNSIINNNNNINPKTGFSNRLTSILENTVGLDDFYSSQEKLLKITQKTIHDKINNEIKEQQKNQVISKEQEIESNTNQINSNESNSKNNILLMSKDKEIVQPDKNKSVSETILNAQKNDVNLSNEQINALGNMSREDRAKQINVITKDKKQQGKINLQAEKVAQNNIIERESNEINEDLNNNSFWSSIWHVIKTIPTNAIDNLMNIGVTIDNIFSNSNDTGRIQAAQTITSKNDGINANINNEVVRTAGNVGLVLGDMAPSIISELMMPGSGRFVAALGSGSSAYAETLNEEGTNKGQALLTGLLKGGTTYATEGIAGGNILGRGNLDDIAKRFISNKTSSKIAKRIMSKAYEVGGEILEEQVENHVGYVIDKMVNDKDITLEEYINDFNETNKVTFLTTIILSLFGMGGNTYKEIINEERINAIDSKTQESIKEAEKIINENNLSLVDNKNIEDESLKTYTILNIDNNSNVLGLTQTVGKEIELDNKELKIKPAVVRNHGYFEIIDGESGIKLDTSGYLTEEEAIQGFNKKIKNADKGTIYNVNDKATKGKLAMINTVNQIQQEMNNFNNNLINQYDNNNYIDTGVLPEINNSINNNYDTKAEISKIENPKVRDLRTAISQIQDNSYYNSNRANEIMKTVSDNFDNVTYTPKGKSSTLTIKNDNGNTMYSKDIRNNIGYSGKSIKNILSNVYNYVMDNQNANSNSTQTSSEQNTDNNSSNATNYAVQDIKKVTEPFSKQESYTRDEMAEVWNNEISNNNYDAYYDDNGNIERYIAIEEDGNNIVVNQYDNNNNVVKSEVVPNENGKYTSSDIQDTLDRVASLYDENRQIKGQQDIEGNEVKSMKKKNNKTTLSDEEIRNIVKYNPDGREIQDTDYVDFMKERFKDRSNISNIETTTTETNTLLNETLEEAKNKVGTSEANKIRNKQKELMISKLYSKIKNKKFKVTKKLKNENGNIETKELDIEISKNGLKESFNKSISNEKYAVVPFLDKLIQTSNSGTIRNETKLRQNIDEWYYLYNTAIVDNQLYGVKIDIKKTGQGDRFYVHRLNIIKEGTSNSESIFKDDTIRNNKIPSSTNSIAQKSQTVKSKTKPKTNKSQTNKTIKSLEDIKAKYKNQTDQLNIFENKDNTISINNLVVKQNLRNKGIGQNILNDIIDYADKNGKTITLTPTSQYLTKNRLTNWYKKNGFVENKGRNTNYSISDTMYRLPKTSNDDGVRAMKNTSTKVTDSEGRTLTKQQQEYFKDSKVRDKNGNLLVMYHGTDRAFTEFKNKYIQHGRAVTDGFYLTPDRTNASEYGNNIMELYANIKNPLYLHNYNGVTRELIDRGYASDTDGLIKKYNLETDNSGVVPTAKALTKLVKKLGYDGIITTTNENDTIDTDWSATQIVVFNSNQIKNITNSSPTSDKDIRYMKRNTSRSNTSQNSTTVDNQRRTLSKQQQEYFKNSKIRDSKGNLQTVYHTSKNDFTVFDPTKTEHYRFGKNNVNYYTDNKNMSLSYSLENPKLYEGYLNITNPYVINAHGAEWNKVNKTFDKTLIDKINKITPSLKQEIVNKAQETSQAREKMWNDYQNEVDKIHSLKNKITPSDKFYRVDELENLINKKVSSQRTSDEKEYLTLRKRSEQLYSNYNNYDETAEFYKYFENNKEFDSVVNSLSYKQKDELKTVSRNEFYEIAKLGFNQENIADRFGYYETTNDIVFNVLEENKSRKQKYDGVIIKNVVDYGNYSTYDGEGDVFVTFNSNQFKNVDNTNPTSNQDIRFAKKTVKPVDDVLEPGQTNAQRESNYIEQEIRKIEQTGNWDDSIPVTKMTDIRKTIEDYLGIGVQKGHFRQQAYGIYKGNRDVIRTKELKDIDTILHETGHALDIGNRIKINKESISNELLKAVNNYGGYEAETREIQLEEGFAEVIREYAIVFEQAKIDYPQTVTVLEGIRQENKDFDNFIRTVQEQSYNYIHQNPRNRGGLSNQSIGERTDKMPLTPESIRQTIIENVWDSNYPLKRAVQVLQEKGGSKELRASDNAYLLTRLASGIGDKVTSMLSNGYIDENGNRLFPGLSQLGEVLENNAERFNDLRAYLVAQRDLEYKAKGLKTGIRTNDSKAIIKQFKNDTQIQEASRIIYDTLDGVLQYAVNNKLITPENAQTLRESNVFYVPMQRVIGTNGNNVGRKGAVADIIKSRTGSELDIKDVLENIVANSANIIQQVENNKIINALYTQGENAGLTGSVYDEIDPPMKKVGVARLDVWQNELKNQGVDIEKIDFDKTMDIFVPNNNIDEKNQIVSFIDNRGQRRYLQFKDELLFKTLTGLDRESVSRVLNFCEKLNKPLRFGATIGNLGFAIPNMIADTVQASIYSEAGFIPVIDTAIGALDVLSAKNKIVRNFMKEFAPQYAERVNNIYELYNQSGATSATRIGQERKSTQKIMKDIYGTKNSEVLGIPESFKPLKKLHDIMTYIPELSEQSTRFRAFEKNLEFYRRNGMAEIDARLEAALQSRDVSQDFSRMGRTMREINKVVPFSAARVGSIYTFSEKMKANPKRTSVRIAVMLALNMLIKGLTADDDEIQELNQRKKDDNFVFKIGDQVITVKKPQGFLRSLINLNDYIIDLANGNIDEGKEGERLKDWLFNAIMDNSISDDITGMVPSAITPILENAINKDLYYNSDIVKSYDLDLPDSEQYYDYNSQLAIWLGQIFNYSPAKIDNFISGYFAGLGTQVTNIIDWIVSKTGATPEEPDMGLESNSIGKRFFVNVNSNSASVDEVYNLKTELTKKKNGGTITSEESQQLEDVTNATSEMAKLNKQIKEIKKDLTMSGEEKAEQIKLLQQQKVDTARKSLGKEVLYSENETNIESTTFYPSRDTLSQNGYSLNLTSDMKKEYEELAYNKYKEYENQGLYSEEKLEKIREKCKDYAKSQLLKKYKNDLIKKSK